MRMPSFFEKIKIDNEEIDLQVVSEICTGDQNMHLIVSAKLFDRFSKNKEVWVSSLQALMDDYLGETNETK